MPGAQRRTSTSADGVVIETTHAGGRQGLLCWGEVSIKMGIPDSYSSIGYTFGHQKLAADDEPDTLSAVEQEIFDMNEVIVTRRVRRLRRKLGM